MTWNSWKKVGENLHDFGFGIDLMQVTPKAQAAKQKPVELHQTKMFLCSIENNHHSDEAAKRMGENIYEP